MMIIDGNSWFQFHRWEKSIFCVSFSFSFSFLLGVNGITFLQIFA